MMHAESMFFLSCSGVGEGQYRMQNKYRKRLFVIFPKLRGYGYIGSDKQPSRNQQCGSYR